jgi:hypothetical protein
MVAQAKRKTKNPTPQQTHKRFRFIFTSVRWEWPDAYPARLFFGSEKWQEATFRG